MQNTDLEFTAIRESARVVFSYLNGYWCDSIQLEADGAAAGAQLNPGNDLAVIQKILSGKTSSFSETEKDNAVKTAKKLMSIYSAGACAETFFRNDEQLPDELNLDLPAADLRNIEKIQSFLKASIWDHSDDFPSQTLITVLKKMQQPDIWNPIKALAKKLLESETNSLTGFYIEDTLMMHGIKRQRQTSSQGFVVGVVEDKGDKKKQADEPTKPSAFELPEQTPLDVMLTDFLKMVKTDWQGEELEAAKTYLKKLFAKYGQ